MSIVSFLKCLTIMDLALAGKDVKRAATVYQKWSADAAPLLKKHGVLKEFTQISAEFKSNDWEFTEEQGQWFGSFFTSRNPVFVSFVADKSISHTQIEYLKRATLFLRQDSDPAWEHLKLNVPILNDNKLSAMFLSKTTKDVADLSTQQTMIKIVKKLTGRIDDPTLAPAEIRALKDDNKKIMAQYLSLYSEFKVRYKNALMTFVRTSGKEFIDVRNAASYLDAMGCNMTPIVFKDKVADLSELSGKKGTPFPGKIDERGKLYTPDGKPLEGTMMTGRFWINTSYDPKTDDTFYAKTQDLARGELRTAHMNKGNAKERHAKVRDFAGEVLSHRKAWLEDLDNEDDFIQLCACITEICFSTHARVGTVGNENKGEPTFGITTLKPAHVKTTAQGLKISYPGKKGTMNHHEIKPNSAINRKIIKIVTSYRTDCPSGEYIFVLDGKHVKAGSRSARGTVNHYLAGLGVPITLHKFRHAFATHAAMEMLKKSPFNAKNVPTEEQAKRWIKTEAEKIGAMLHHRTGSGDKEKVTSTVAFKAYIDPSIIREWFASLGLRQPDKSWLPDFDD